MYIYIHIYIYILILIKIRHIYINIINTLLIFAHTHTYSIHTIFIVYLYMLNVIAYLAKVVPPLGLVLSSHWHGTVPCAALICVEPLVFTQCHMLQNSMHSLCYNMYTQYILCSICSFNHFDNGDPTGDSSPPRRWRWRCARQPPIPGDHHQASQRWGVAPSSWRIGG